MPTIGVLQMCSGVDPEANLAIIEDAAKQCAKRGALTSTVGSTASVSVCAHTGAAKAVLSNNNEGGR